MLFKIYGKYSKTFVLRHFLLIFFENNFVRIYGPTIYNLNYFYIAIDFLVFINLKLIQSIILEIVLSIKYHSNEDEISINKRRIIMFTRFIQIAVMLLFHNPN